MGGGFDFLRGFGAVIFDLDGTLADSMPVWEALLPDWAAAEGLVLPAGLTDEIAVMTTAQAAAHIVARMGLSASHQDLEDTWQRLLIQGYRSRVHPKTGAPALLHALAKAGIPMGIATSGIPQACEGFLQANGIDRFFRAIRYTDSTGADKTSPLVYLACAAALDVPPACCVVLEDLPAALLGVRAAGMGLVAVYDAACKDWNAFSADADLAVKSLTELLP